MARIRKVDEQVILRKLMALTPSRRRRLLQLAYYRQMEEYKREKDGRGFHHPKS